MSKDPELTGFVKHSTCVPAIVLACHLPRLNKWCVAVFVELLSTFHGGLLRPISCRERAVRGRSRVTQFRAAQLNNELKAIMRLCEARRSAGGAGSRCGFVTVRDEPIHTDMLLSLDIGAPREERR